MNKKLYGTNRHYIFKKNHQKMSEVFPVILDFNSLLHHMGKHVLVKKMLKVADL